MTLNKVINKYKKGLQMVTKLITGVTTGVVLALVVNVARAKGANV